MQAFWFEQFGQAAAVLQQGEQPTPQPAAGEVLVRLHATGVNPSDVKKRAGAFPNLLDTGPVIPHSDGAGVIEAVGDGVSPTRLGERVFVYQAQHDRLGGTAAQWVCIESRRAPVLPDNASFEVGACIGIPMMTAHRCVTADGPVAGQWVLLPAVRVGWGITPFNGLAILVHGLWRRQETTRTGHCVLIWALRWWSITISQAGVRSCVSSCKASGCSVLLMLSLAPIFQRLWTALPLVA